MVIMILDNKGPVRTQDKLVTITIAKITETVGHTQ
jgi:hypothetical protein